MFSLFIANDEPLKVDEFLEKRDYELPVYFQLAKAPEELKSNSLPTTYIIDTSGKIIVNKKGAADWNSGKVRDLLDKLLAQ